MKRRFVPVVVVGTLLAFGGAKAGAVSGDGGVTYHFLCGAAFTIDATVQSVSSDNTFHVTDVSGGGGAVSVGNNLILKSAVLSNGTSFSDPGFTKNGQPTISCTWTSPRTGGTGTGSFFVTS